MAGFVRGDFHFGRRNSADVLSLTIRYVDFRHFAGGKSFAQCEVHCFTAAEECESYRMQIESTMHLVEQTKMNEKRIKENCVVHTDSESQTYPC